jgi:hypothetical protein
MKHRTLDGSCRMAAPERMSSSDSIPPGARWTRHYEQAARRRRARGFHRRGESHRSGHPARRRLKLYVAAGMLFVAITLVAMFLPR